MRSKVGAVLSKAWSVYSEASKVMGIPALIVSIGAFAVAYSNLELQKSRGTPLVVITDQSISSFRAEVAGYSGGYSVYLQNLGTRPAQAILFSKERLSGQRVRSQ